MRRYLGGGGDLEHDREWGGMRSPRDPTESVALKKWPSTCQARLRIWKRSRQGGSGGQPGNDFDEHSGWTAASRVTLYVWTSVAPLACLGLFGLALSHVKRSAGTIRQISAENGKEQFTSVQVGVGKSIEVGLRQVAKAAVPERAPMRHSNGAAREHSARRS